MIAEVHLTVEPFECTALSYNDDVYSSSIFTSSCLNYFLMELGTTGAEITMGLSLGY
jgi:hypothetical protein